MHKNNSWEDICREVAENEGIDEYGMSETAVKLLTSLYEQGTIPLKRLPYFLNKKVEEIESFVLPALVESTDEQPAMVMITPRGVKLTDEGCQELVKRNLVESCGDLSNIDEEYFQNIE
jgi:Holliday junction resolvasome RuvABC ATP-dependent DNA helicase subunit